MNSTTQHQALYNDVVRIAESGLFKWIIPASDYNSPDRADYLTDVDFNPPADPVYTIKMSKDTMVEISPTSIQIKAGSEDNPFARRYLIKELIEDALKYVERCQKASWKTNP